jgi:carboxypeptidase Q
MHDRWAGITAGMILSAVFLHAQAAEGHGYDYNKVEPQPATESLDLGAYARIREEGFNHSHIMEYASALFDDIGPRLTGSPNLAKANAWTRDQLAAMGCVNAHLES